MHSAVTANRDESDLALPTDGIVVNDLTEQIEAIDLVVIPGQGLTFNGQVSIEDCLDRIDPCFRSSSPQVKRAFARYAKRVIGIDPIRG